MNTRIATGDGLAPLPRLLAVFVMTCAVCACSLTFGIVNAALPVMSTALNVTPQDTVALVASFQVSMVATLIPLAALGEIVGYRRVYLAGLAVFGLSSAMISASGQFEAALFWRFVQGVGAAGVLSVNTAILRFVYPRASFGRGLGLNAFVAGSSTALGPSVAAVVLSLANWHWLFLLNVPICIVALIIGAIIVPETPRADRRLNIISLLQHLFAMVALLSAIQLIAIRGLSAGSVVLAVVGVTALGLYLARECKRDVPLFPIDLLRIRPFRLSVSASVLAFAAQIVVLTVVPFWLDRAMQASQAEIGYLLSLWPMMSMLAALASGVLLDRFTARRLGIAGMVIFGFGLLILAFVHPGTPYFIVGAVMILCGLGFGLFQTPNNKMMLSAAPEERAGSASGSLGTARMIGQSFGSAGAAVALAFSPATALNISVPLALLLAGAAAVASANR